MAKKTYLISYRPKNSTRYYAVEVLGEPVIIENTGLDFFVYRAMVERGNILEQKGLWRVAEKTTGAYLAEGNTRKLAIESATERLSNLSVRGQLGTAMKLFVVGCGEVSKLDILRYDESKDQWIPVPQNKSNEVTP